jgi:hypothetical protein
MAGVARHILMPTLQWEISIESMIEDQLLPLFSTMALGAYLAIAPIVRVIDQMAANTLFRCILVVIAGVAQFTVQLSMLTSKGVFRIQVMIETLLSPALFVMAGITLFTQFALVSVI